MFKFISFILIAALVLSIYALSSMLLILLINNIFSSMIPYTVKTIASVAVLHFITFGSINMNLETIKKRFK